MTSALNWLVEHIYDAQTTQQDEVVRNGHTTKDDPQSPETLRRKNNISPIPKLPVKDFQRSEIVTGLPDLAMSTQTNIGAPES